MAVLLMHVGMPLSPDELAVMTDETPNSATSVLSVLLAFRLCTRTPAGLYSVRCGCCCSGSCCEAEACLMRVTCMCHAQEC
eukprot:1565540-Rhodomonas_salina.4